MGHLDGYVVKKQEKQDWDLALSRGRTTNKSVKNADASGGQKAWAEALPSPFGKKDQPKQTKNPLAGRTDARVTDIKAPEIPNKRVKGSKAIRFPLAGRIDENAKTTEIYVQPMRRLEFHTDNPINFRMDYSLGNTAPVTTSRCDHVMERSCSMIRLRHTGCILECLLLSCSSVITDNDQS